MRFGHSCVVHVRLSPIDPELGFSLFDEFSCSRKLFVLNYSFLRNQANMETNMSDYTVLSSHCNLFVAFHSLTNILWLIRVADLMCDGRPIYIMQTFRFASRTSVVLDIIRFHFYGL